MADLTSDKMTASLMVWLSGLAVIFIAVFLPVWENLLSGLYDDYSAGLLVLPLCLYLVWGKKDVLRRTKILPSNWGLVLTIFSLLLYVIGYRGGIVTLASFSMILALVGMILYLFGFAVLRTLAFPLAFLLFMVPVPSQIYVSLTFPLQLFVTKASVWIAEALNVPVIRQGNVINIPGKTLEVVAACSGLRSLIYLAMWAALVGFYSLKSYLGKIVLFLFSIPAAIFMNIVRISSVVLAFYFMKIDLSVEPIHDCFGFFVFAIACALIYLVSRGLSLWDKSKNAG